MAHDNAIPREVLDAMGGDELESNPKLDAIGTLICQKRDAATKARKESGIEETWTECEEAYIGIDEENRGEFTGIRWSKPTSMTGPLTSDKRLKDSGEAARSTAYVEVTRRYVDAGHAKVCEIILPIDDKAFSFTATPVPEFLDSKDDDSQVMHNGQPLLRDATKDDMPPPSPMGAEGEAQPTEQPETVPLVAGDLAKEAIEKANAAAKKAEKRIYDWMVECAYPAEMRKVIFNGAKLGSGVLKGPFADVAIHRAMQGEGDTLKMVIEKEVRPAVCSINPWNFFPADDAGDDIHRGSHIFEYDELSERQVKELKGQKGYIESQIDMVIEQGPEGKKKDDGQPGKIKRNAKSLYPVWYFTGTLTRKELETLEAVGLDGVPEDKEDISVVVTIINDVPVKAIVNPLESGEFPYHVFNWQKRAGYWAGVGVAEQMKTPQRMVNAATRAWLNNAGKSAGSQIVIQRGMINPADGSYILTPDKLWFMSPDATIDDVRKIFATFQIPNVGDSLQKIVEYALKLAEESTSIPLISQGQSGPQQPDTFGATQLQNNNANQLLRSVGNSIDDDVTEPIVNQFYEWLLLDPDVPADEKGDWNIHAQGSSALVERAIQYNVIAQMAQMVMNPAYGIDPAKYITQYLKSQRLDPREFQYTDDERAKMAEQPPTPPPPVQVAEINAKARLEAAKMDTDRDTVYVQAQSARDDNDSQFRIQELQLRRELALLDYANREKTSLDKVKTDLAKTAMIENTRKELAAAEIALARGEGAFERTHDLNKHVTSEEKGINKDSPSLIRDEVSTPVTP